MTGSYKNTLKHTAIYGLGNISSKLVGFILLPLYTSYLSVNEYGVLAILEITSQLLIGIFSLNIHTAMMRWASEVKDAAEQKSIIFTTFVTTLIISCALFLLALPFNNSISNLFFGNTNFSNYITLLFLTSSFGIYNLFPLNLLRLNERSTLFAILNTGKFTLTLISNFILIAKYNMGVEGILISLLVGQIFLALFTIPILLKNIILKFDIPVLKEMVAYGLPLIFTTLFSLLLTTSDRFIIKYFHGDASVGIYSLGYKIASVINMLLIQSFQLGFLPIAYKKLNDEDAEQFYSKTLTYFTFVLTLFALAISLFGKELLLLLTKNNDYLLAYSVIPIISFAFVLKGVQYVFSLGFHYAKKTTYSAGIVVISAIINISLNIVLVKYWGYVGASYSMLLSFLFMLILTYIFSQKVYKINYNLKKLLHVVLLGLFVFIVSLNINLSSILFTMLVKITLFAAFLITLYITKFFTPNEIRKFSSIRKSIFSKIKS